MELNRLSCLPPAPRLCLGHLPEWNKLHKRIMGQIWTHNLENCSTEDLLRPLITVPRHKSCMSIKRWKAIDRCVLRLVYDKVLSQNTARNCCYMNNLQNERLIHTVDYHIRTWNVKYEPQHSLHRISFVLNQYFHRIGFLMLELLLMLLLVTFS